MGMFWKNSKSKQEVALRDVEEVDQRIISLITRSKMRDLFEQLIQLPVCIVMDSNNSDIREIWNVQNGMVLTETSDEESCLFQIHSGTRYSTLDVERMEKILSAWGAMTVSVELTTSAHRENEGVAQERLPLLS